LFAARIILLFFALLVTGSAPAQELKIAAASDLDAPMQKLGPAFTKQTGVQLKFSFGSSGSFFAEIRNGAPFDVYLSADRSYPETLDQSGKTDAAPTTYALGRLVLWVSHKVPGNPSSNNLDFFNSPNVHKIAIANPDHEPYGRAAVAAMVHYKVYDQVKSKLVLGENISQTAQFAESGNADVALIALSTALTDSMRKSGRYVIVTLGSYPPLYQAGVVLRSSQHKQQAHRFLEFLRSPGGQKIMQEYGFEVPKLARAR